ncbi:hypothetical protein BJX64DRAFT_149364 [Aspergillus heterothallicus]
MANQPSDAISQYETNISRLQTVLSGYEWFKQRSNESPVRVQLMDVDSNGDVHSQTELRWTATDSAEDLYVRLKDQADAVMSRFIVVEDLSSSVCIPLGAALGLDPQFFIDHMTNHIPDEPKIKQHSPEWNAWNLAKPYISLRWYRPVEGLSSSLGPTPIREYTEQRVIVRHGEGLIPEYQWKQFYPATNIMRPEIDMFVPRDSVPAPTPAVAIEERMSIYHIDISSCKYVIVLLDPVPEYVERFWKAPPRSSGRYAHPDFVSDNKPLYTTLVPRFLPNITGSEAISNFNEDVLRNTYRVVPSTMGYICDRLHQLPDKPFLLKSLFHIIVSDTLAFLNYLHKTQKSIVAATVSQDSKVEDILATRAFITTKHSLLSSLRLEFELALDALVAKPLPGGSHGASSLQIRTAFDRVILELEVTLSSVTGALQFMENHRAISEAESITRLTELAFLFIPLTFAASLFSMQIQELSRPAPVTYFVAFALSLSAVTYSFRLPAQ